MDTSSLTLSAAVRFWLPLAASWLLMAQEDAKCEPFV